MAESRTSSTHRQRSVKVAARQPFLELRRSVVDAAVTTFGPALLPQDPSALVPVSETDPQRLAEGFDYCVPCSPLGRALDVRADVVATRLAAAIGGSGSLSGADAEGQYLNLRVDRARFTDAVFDATGAGVLGRCDHPPGSRRDYCLVAPELADTDERLRLLGSMAANCSGSPVDTLPEAPDAAERVIADLVAGGAAASDRSRLTSAVMMGRPGDRFLVRDPSGRPTTAVRVASRLSRSGDRPVLLVVGGHQVDLHRRVAEILSGTGLDDIDVRVVTLQERWSQLHRLLSASMEDDRAVLDLRTVPRGSRQIDDSTFAVVRSLVRLPDVSHRTLATVDPGYLLRLVTHTRRRLEAAARQSGAGTMGLDALLAAGFRSLVPAPTHRTAEDESTPL